MINEVARMDFQSARKPNEKGALVITEDGFFQVEPSEEFVAELIDLESHALEGSRKRGNLIGGLLIGIGFAVIATAWIASRMGGEMRETLTLPRPVEDVDIRTDDHGGIQVTLPGVGPQRVKLEWEAGETNAVEAARFASVHRQFVGNVRLNKLPVDSR